MFPSLTVEEHLTAVARPGHWNVARVYEVFPRLEERRGNFGNQLSGGEQQMLAIGRALMVNPSLLLLDEPMEGLAPIIVQELMSVIRELVDRQRHGGDRRRAARQARAVADAPRDRARARPRRPPCDERGAACAIRRPCTGWWRWHDGRRDRRRRGALHEGDRDHPGRASRDHGGDRGPAPPRGRRSRPGAWRPTTRCSARCSTTSSNFPSACTTRRRTTTCSRGCACAGPTPRRCSTPSRASTRSAASASAS